MALKSIVYFIFISILSYWGGGDIFTKSNAASVIPATKPNPANQSIKPNKDEKKILLSNPIIEIDTSYLPVSFIQISDFTNPPSYTLKNNKKSETGQAQRNSISPALYTNLYDQGKEFFIAHKNNEVLQDSLIIFSQTKQFLREKDLMLHDLTQDIFLSLNLAGPNQNKLFFLQQKNKMDTSAKNSYPQNFRQQSETMRLQDLDKFNNAEKYTSDNSLFELIFNRKNLYYLIAIIFLFYIAKQIIKFMFMKDLHNKQNGR